MMIEDVELPVTAPHGAFEFTGTSATHFDNASFNFPSFGYESLKLLNFQRNASVLSPYLHLSLCQPNQSLNGISGRATYSRKVHLWDKATGNEADFTAGFMFSIDSRHRNDSGDGLTFFIAPWGFSMPRGLGGGQLGLPKDSYC
ncbi:bark agglutinin I polypeptide B-like [Syzygium oleosum]|uniref:bark agglutinin I polypeptide B-like n=1 Tax=Syzygium oleosum TaxID=219896 RepID=UPI0011D24049|nr:bark agglutinin I polypeptide B-like [Syzygium oleosum]